MNMEYFCFLNSRFKKELSPSHLSTAVAVEIKIIQLKTMFTDLIEVQLYFSERAGMAVPC